MTQKEIEKHGTSLCLKIFDFIHKLKEEGVDEEIVHGIFLAEQQIRNTIDLAKKIPF